MSPVSSRSVTRERHISLLAPGYDSLACKRPTNGSAPASRRRHVRRCGGTAPHARPAHPGDGPLHRGDVGVLVASRVVNGQRREQLDLAAVSSTGQPGGHRSACARQARAARRADSARRPASGLLAYRVEIGGAGHDLRARGPQQGGQARPAATATTAGRRRWPACRDVRAGCVEISDGDLAEPASLQSRLDDGAGVGDVDVHVPPRGAAGDDERVAEQVEAVAQGRDGIRGRVQQERDLVAELRGRQCRPPRRPLAPGSVSRDRVAGWCRDCEETRGCPLMAALSASSRTQSPAPPASTTPLAASASSCCPGAEQRLARRQRRGPADLGRSAGAGPPRAPPPSPPRRRRSGRCPRPAGARRPWPARPPWRGRVPRPGRRTARQGRRCQRGRTATG